MTKNDFTVLMMQKQVGEKLKKIRAERDTPENIEKRNKTRDFMSLKHGKCKLCDNYRNGNSLYCRKHADEIKKSISG